MPFYNDLRPVADFEKRDFIRVFPGMTHAEKLRTIDGIIRLRTALDQQIPPRRAVENLLIASWNIKEFGHTSQRLPEAYYYIAEILARFDLVAIQEIKSTRKDLDIVLRILGSDWTYLVNDNVFGNNTFLTLANRASFGLWAVLVCWWILIPWALVLHWRRWRQRREETLTPDPSPAERERGEGPA